MLFCTYCFEFDADASNVPRSIKCKLHMADRIRHLRDMKSLQPLFVVRVRMRNLVFFLLSHIFSSCNFLHLQFYFASFSSLRLISPFLTGIFFAATVFVSTQTVDMKDRTPRS